MTALIRKDNKIVDAEQDYVSNVVPGNNSFEMGMYGIGTIDYDTIELYAKDWSSGSLTKDSSYTPEANPSNDNVITADADNNGTTDQPGQASGTISNTIESTAITEPQSSSESTAAQSSGIRPEFKEAMDSYSAFFDSYCDFMKSYDSYNITMLIKYSEMMTQYADTMEKIDAIDESTLSSEEDAYFLQTMAHINQEIAEAAQYLSN